MSDKFRGTIDSVSIYELSNEAISEWQYKLKPGESICKWCDGVIRDDNRSLHMRCGGRILRLAFPQSYVKTRTMTAMGRAIRSYIYQYRQGQS